MSGRGRAPRLSRAQLALVAAPVISGGTISLADYVSRWLERRARVRPRSVSTDRQRLQSLVVPTFGASPLINVAPSWIRAWVAELVTAGMAPRTVRRAYATLSWVLRDAVVDGLLHSNPCILGPADLPPDEDADPEWRAGFVFTADELVTLITSPSVPPSRRVLWALCGLAGLRIGEAAALRWSDFRRALGDTPELFVARAFDTSSKAMSATKTSAIRRVPVHPVLEGGLVWWHELGWARVYGQLPRAEDLIAPTRALGPIRADNAGDRMATDLRRLGFRGDRTPHALRHTFLTLARAARCHTEIIRRVTHARSRDVVEGYSRTEWAALAAEVCKIEVVADMAPEKTASPEQRPLPFRPRTA